MRGSIHRRSSASSGFTLLEMTVALSLFSVLGYTLMSAVWMAHQSHQAVMTSTVENVNRRKTSARLIDEFASANSNTLTVDSAVGTNDSVTFQLPVTVAGAAVWGIKEQSLSSVPANQSVAGWSIRYTVVQLPWNGAQRRSLVRQVIDGVGVVQVQDAVVDGLRSGALNPKGFSVEQAGDLWELTITTEGNAEGSGGRSTVFHVKTRN